MFSTPSLCVSIGRVFFYALFGRDIWSFGGFDLFLRKQITMADNFLERQYAAYEEKKAAMKSGIKKKKPSVQFYTRPGKKENP